MRRCVIHTDHSDVRVPRNSTAPGVTSGATTRVASQYTAHAASEPRPATAACRCSHGRPSIGAGGAGEVGG